MVDRGVGFNIFISDAAHSITNTAGSDGSGIAARIPKPQMPSSGKKYHQPISFSFADIMEKVRAADIVCNDVRYPSVIVQ